MTGAHHGQDLAVTGRLLDEPRDHVVVALLDQGYVDALALAGELVEGRLEQVAFLEGLDLLLGDLLVAEGGGEQAAEEGQALPPWDVRVDAPQRHADVAIDEEQGRLAAFAACMAAFISAPGSTPNCSAMRCWKADRARLTASMPALPSRRTLKRSIFE